MAFDLTGKAVSSFDLPTVNYSEKATVVIAAQQSDANSRFLEIGLYDDRGALDLSPYEECKLNATLPDKKTKRRSNCEINKETGKIICRLFASMLAQKGNVVCDLTLLGKDGNEILIRLTSQTFYIYVSESQNTTDFIDGSDEIPDDDVNTAGDSFYIKEVFSNSDNWVEIEDDGIAYKIGVYPFEHKFTMIYCALLQIKDGSIYKNADFTSKISDSGVEIIVDEKRDGRIILYGTTNTEAR